MRRIVLFAILGMGVIEMTRRWPLARPRVLARLDCLMTIFKPLFFFLAIGILGLAGSAKSELEKDTSPSTLSAEEILERALERAQWSQEQNHRTRYTFEVLEVKQKLDGDGEIEEVERQKYQSVPVGEAAYSRLVEKDGRPLTAEELEEERKREREFLEKVNQGEKASDEDQVRFNRELMGRYDIELKGSETLKGRNTFVLSFQPKKADLPEKNRIDRALNKARGRLWVDREVFEVARVEFELLEAVKLWWGILGSVSKLEGNIEMAPLKEGVWFPEVMELYIKGRIAFKSLHEKQILKWGDFMPADLQ